jgi:hypothetical protein
MGSVASAMSMLSAASYQSRVSLLSGQSDGSVQSWQGSRIGGHRHDGGSWDPVLVGSLVAGTTVLVATGWIVVRRLSD